MLEVPQPLIFDEASSLPPRATAGRFDNGHYL